MSNHLNRSQGNDPTIEWNNGREDRQGTSQAPAHRCRMCHSRAALVATDFSPCGHRLHYRCAKQLVDEYEHNRGDPKVQRILATYNYPQVILKCPCGETVTHVKHYVTRPTSLREFFSKIFRRGNRNKRIQHSRSANDGGSVHDTSEPLNALESKDQQSNANDHLHANGTQPPGANNPSIKEQQLKPPTQPPADVQQPLSQSLVTSQPQANVQQAPSVTPWGAIPQRAMLGEPGVVSDRDAVHAEALQRAARS